MSATPLAGKDPARELYEAGTPARLREPATRATESGAQIADGPGPQDKDLRNPARTAGAQPAGNDYAGEFEQRTPGERGTGPAGEVRSREALLEALRRRVAEDPELAHCDVRIGLGAQGVELAGRVPDQEHRERLRELAEAAGAGRVDDQLQVAGSQHGGEAP
jgi:osmotically-inducible protein OsmY